MPEQKSNLFRLSVGLLTMAGPAHKVNLMDIAQGEGEHVRNTNTQESAHFPTFLSSLQISLYQHLPKHFFKCLVFHSQTDFL